MSTKASLQALHLVHFNVKTYNQQAVLHQAVNTHFLHATIGGGCLLSGDYL